MQDRRTSEHGDWSERLAFVGADERAANAVKGVADTLRKAMPPALDALYADLERREETASLFKTPDTAVR
ncbi:MAG: protoglobin domain-containing protein, partial [Oceanicaulis sp.]